ncbi:LysR family transcriptional regulator [Dactylosporangium sp. CS-047395]|uniref:LysR family transcriptional regulator n=1 Tax=Dactylosporangium sp. CS-047395 TaxID=3239936 RepID=UPI003D89B4AE
MDLDLRKLRYFVAVAEQLHFGRAAQALHVAQPMLSRQIRVFERELHAQLFVRDRHGVALTPAGVELLESGRPLLAEAARVQRRVRADAFAVAFMPGLVVTGAVRALERNHPGLVVEVVRTYWDEQTAVLRDGRADVSYVRLPVEEGPNVLALGKEPRVVALPAGHPLAGKESVRLVDLDGETLLQPVGAVPEWRYATAAGAPARSVEEKLELVAREHGIVVLPRSVSAYYRRPDVAVVLVEDLPPGEIGLAWEREHRLLGEFVAAAKAFAPCDTLLA